MNYESEITNYGQSHNNLGMSRTLRNFLVLLALPFFCIGSFILLNNQVLIEMRGSWGPCPLEKTCKETTTLYTSGLFHVRGDKTIIRWLDPWTMKEVKQFIHQSGVMDLKCVGELWLDSTQEYIIHLDGKTQTFKNAMNCQVALKGIGLYLPEE